MGILHGVRLASLQITGFDEELMKIARALGCGIWLVTACGGGGDGPIEPPEIIDNHDEMVLETIPYDVLGSTRLSFLREENTRRGMVSLDGSFRTASITYSYQGFEAAVSPTTRTLAYMAGTPSANTQRGYDIYIRSWEASTATPLGGPGGARYEPSWTPDGTRLIFSEASDYAGPSTRIVSQSPVPEASDRQVLWSATGDCEFASAPRQNGAGDLVFIYIPAQPGCSLRGSIARQRPGMPQQILYAPTAASVSLPAWSPSGAEIAFLEIPPAPGGSTEVRIMVMAADGSNVRTIATVTSASVVGQVARSMCWARDGSRLFFNLHDELPERAHIYGVAVTTGVMTRITSLAGVRDGSVSCG